MQVREEALDDPFVGLLHQRRRAAGAREQHQGSARATPAAAAQRVRLVGEHVERAPGRGHGVDVVVGHRRRFARLDRHAQERAVGQLRERVGGLLGHGCDERRCVRRLRGEDHLARAHLAAVVLHDQVGALGPEGVHAAAGAGAPAELATERRRQATGATDQVARDQRALAAPHEGEQPDPAPGRELVQLRGGAVRRAGEDLVHSRWKRTEEGTEAAVILEVEALPGRVVSSDGALDLHPCPRERDPVAQRERQPERIGLDTPAVEQRRADRQPHHAAGDRDGVETAVARHAVHQRARRREQMRAVVEPVLAAGIRAHAPAETIAGLEHQDVAMAQPPCRRESGDAAADDYDFTRHRLP